MISEWSFQLSDPFVYTYFSGGKDSCYNMMQCVKAGHQIVALANLKPPDSAGKLFI